MVILLIFNVFTLYQPSHGQRKVPFVCLFWFFSKMSGKIDENLLIEQINLWGWSIIYASPCNLPSICIPFLVLVRPNLKLCSFRVSTWWKLTVLIALSYQKLTRFGPKKLRKLDRSWKKLLLVHCLKTKRESFESLTNELDRG